MAETAKPTNGISSKMVEAFLDRMQGLEEEARSMMGSAMNEIKEGPRAGQKEIVQEAKDAGIRGKVFRKMWLARKREMDAENDFEGLDEEDRDQMLRCANAFPEDSPFRALLLRRLGDSE